VRNELFFFAVELMQWCGPGKVLVWTERQEGECTINLTFCGRTCVVVRASTLEVLNWTERQEGACAVGVHPLQLLALSDLPCHVPQPILPRRLGAASPARW